MLSGPPTPDEFQSCEIGIVLSATAALSRRPSLEEKPSIPNSKVWRNKMRTHYNWLLLIVLLGALTSPAFAQAKKTPPSAATAASTTAPAATPSASSSAPIESQMIAFGSLQHIAAMVGGTVCSRIDDGSTVVIYDQTSFGSLQPYQAFIENAKAIVSAYETLLPDENGPAGYDKKSLNDRLRRQLLKEKKGLQPRVLGLSGTIDPFADATTLLGAIAISSNTETPGSIVIPDSAMAVAVTRELGARPDCSAKKLTVIYPPLFGRSSSTDFASADIQTDLQRVHDVRDFVIKGVSEQNRAWMEAHATLPSIQTGNPILTAALTDVNGMYDSFMNSLLQVNATTGTLGSAAVIQGFQLANVLAGPAAPNGQFQHPAYILLASILSAGGTIRDHKTLWTALGSGDKITFSGGVIVNVALWKSNDTAPLYSNLLRYRAPFSDVRDPSNLANVTDGDNLGGPK